MNENNNQVVMWRFPDTTFYSLYVGIRAQKKKVQSVLGAWKSESRN